MSALVNFLVRHVTLSQTHALHPSHGDVRWNVQVECITIYIKVTVADGGCHSVAAVIDSPSNRAVLYIDGEPVGIQTPLPNIPEFKVVKCTCFRPIQL